MNECCSTSARVPDLLVSGPAAVPEWVEGAVETAVGPVPRVSTRWGRAEARGQRRCRLSNRFRMSYSVPPGLYAAGSPGPEDPVLVSANYKLSFDLLRQGVAGLSVWILVLDTRGINVWCAAGKGTFGTEELLRRIRSSRLAEVVTRRRLVLPQLAAPGVQAHRVSEASGFAVAYGPVEARDIPAYLASGGRCSAAMRRVSFGLSERLALAPMELFPALRWLPWVLLGVFVFFGLRPEGIWFAGAWTGGWPFAALAVLALLSGTVLTPLALPLIPVRPFALKGWFVGLAVTAGFLLWTFRGVRPAPVLVLMALVLFPAASSFLALNFTGSTTFTGISGVRRELKIGLPLYITALALTLTAAVLYKLAAFGILSWRFLT